MGKIGELLSDPSWWFTAILAGTLVGVAGGLIKDRVDKVVSSWSVRWRQRRYQRLRDRAARLRRQAREPLIVTVCFMFAVLFLTATLASMALAFLVSFWPALLRAGIMEPRYGDWILFLLVGDLVKAGLLAWTVWLAYMTTNALQYGWLLLYLYARRRGLTSRRRLWI
jgi:hypothetical protein